VTPEFFRKQMEYLKTKGYTTVFPDDLVDFFDKGVALPAKPVLITLDDAYEDNYTNAFPILKEYGFKATIFTPTGLIQNPDYLNWQEIKEMSDTGLVYFGNHTWSHHPSTGTPEVLKKEISLADIQLAEKELNTAKIFAYPFGNPSQGAEKVLTDMGYKLAFTTVHGTMMCKGKRFELPRVRMGNSELNKYGL
jgi:peptidoglycan/xylan/chitin deacetylase (PgdA/CDA1 family)